MDYYATLGVDKNASKDDIKKAYRKLMLEHHPDRNQDDEASLNKAKEVNEAYTVLSDDTKRQQYDMSSSGFNPFMHFGFGDMFGHMNPNAPQKGATVNLVEQISLFESLVGCTKTVSFNIKMFCELCSSKCSACNGEGRRVSINGNSMTAMSCPSCRGTGKQSAGCKECSGGIKTLQRSLDLNIPSGVVRGSKVGVAGAGGPGKNGGPNGDIILTIDVKYPDMGNYTTEELDTLKALLTK